MARIEPFEKYSEKYEDWFERNEFNLIQASCTCRDCLVREVNIDD